MHVIMSYDILNLYNASKVSIPVVTCETMLQHCCTGSPMPVTDILVSYRSNIQTCM